MPNDLFTALFKAPKVDKEVTKAAGSTRPLPVNPDLWKAVEIFNESFMVTWHIEWHSTLFSKYLYSKCCQHPVLETVICRLHGAIQESCQTLACCASVAIAAQHCLVVDASAFLHCRDLKSSLLATPFIGSSLFGGLFVLAGSFV